MKSKDQAVESPECDRTHPLPRGGTDLNSLSVPAVLVFMSILPGRSRRNTFQETG